ncbi:MAG: flavin monoamine oxidase family protein [Actinomycetota bacterium]
MDQPRIVIIGAGLAGLTCAYRLHQAGVPVAVFEASDRIGGRCWSDRRIVDGQVAEHGGELIDPSHVHLLRLVRELGLELEDRAAAGAPARATGRIYLDGREVDRSQLVLLEMAELLMRDADRIGDLAFDRAGPEARAFDEMSVIDWLDMNLDGGSFSTLGRIVASVTSQNFGIAPGELGAPALLLGLAEYTTIAARTGALEDELAVAASAIDLVDAIVFALHVRGGNDLVPTALAASLRDGALRMEAPLERIRRHPDETYRLRIEGIGDEIVADRVVLALPFPPLRRVDLDDAGLSDRKRRCIAELPMGSNTKLLLGFERPMSTIASGIGWTTMEPPALTTWDSSLAQPGTGGIATVFTADKLFATDGGHGVPSPAEVDRALAIIEPSIPGISDAFAGNAWLDSWPDDPWAGGSYAGWGPGHMTKYWGAIGLTDGGIHFAGEHTSTLSAGFLDGAVESGERCAKEVLVALGLAR